MNKIVGAIRVFVERSGKRRETVSLQLIEGRVQIILVDLAVKSAAKEENEEEKYRGFHSRCGLIETAGKYFAGLREIRLKTASPRRFQIQEAATFKKESNHSQTAVRGWTGLIQRECLRRSNADLAQSVRDK